jgi:hypothetical protein
VSRISSPDASRRLGTSPSPINANLDLSRVPMKDSSVSNARVVRVVAPHLHSGLPRAVACTAPLQAVVVQVGVARAGPAPAGPSGTAAEYTLLAGALTHIAC